MLILVDTEKNRAIEIEDGLRRDLNNEITRAKREEDTIRAIASSAFHFKGTKPSYDALPKTGNTQGDVWQVGDKEYAWNGTTWVELGFNIDLSPYITTHDAETKISTAKDEAILAAKNYTDQQLLKKQDKLVSGTNIKELKDDKTSAQTLLGSGIISFKTINGISLFGTGNIEIQGGGAGGTVDDALSLTSTNPVQNKVITNAFNTKQELFGNVDNTTSTLTCTKATKFVEVASITNNSANLELASSSSSVDIVAAGDITATTSKYTMSYDTKKEAIVINFT